VIIIIVIIMKTYEAPRTGAQQCHIVHACTEKSNSNMLKTNKSVD